MRQASENFETGIIYSRKHFGNMFAHLNFNSLFPNYARRTFLIKARVEESLSSFNFVNRLLSEWRLFSVAHTHHQQQLYVVTLPLGGTTLVQTEDGFMLATV
jgi:uncharacterized protein involved in type VI secretion and phage assembly